MSGFNPNKFVLMKKLFYITLWLALSFSISAQKTGFDNSTRALYILDISKYVEWDDNIQNKADFIIGILGTDTDFYWELFNMAKTRQFIQNKPIKILLFRDINNIEKSQVLYVNIKEGFKIKQVLEKTKGNNTLVISEGYEFQESMLNFIVVGGEPRFEVNEQRLNEEKLKVSQLFLAQAVKTREDWEALYNVTDKALTDEKVVTKQQKTVIDSQRIQIAEQEKMILEQEERLRALNDEISKKQKTLEQKVIVLNQQEKQIVTQKDLIVQQQEEVNKQNLIITNKQKEIESRNGQIAEQDSLISSQKVIMFEQLKAIEKQRLLIYFTIIALILVSGLVYYIYRGYRIKKEANIKLEEKNRLISAQKDEIQKQKEIAENQRDLITYQKKHITDSIHYAKRIQTALLPSLELFSDEIEHFVLYKPRDIVSGDFYWVAKIDGKQVVIAADCTGHGVPGAFMSMLGVSLLNEIILNQKIIQPDQILNILREYIISSLKQAVQISGIKDGLDMCVCLIDFENNTMQFAGANNPLWIVSDGKLEEIKGNKMPVSIHDTMTPFTNHVVNLKKGDTFYIFSDGYADQFGGPHQKKILNKNFKVLLQNLQDLTMLEQGARIDEFFEGWRKELEQIDDVCVIGIRY
jgi:serine phosphatase RsbU (regulator of sigma subunit)